MATTQQKKAAAEDKVTVSVSRQKKLLTALDGQIEPVPVTLGYKLGLLLVAGGMVLIPLAYLLLTILVFAAVIWHAGFNWSFFKGMQPKAAVFMYVGPLVAGAAVALSLVKPLFARRIGSHSPRRLKRDAEPFLFDYVERVCDAVGATAPSSIRVDCDCNASASFRRGIISMVGTDLTLTIGLPLLAGMSLRQFSGVLAHEFGHFSQGTGMRLSYFIGTINHWLARVVYERDALDARLDAGARTNWGIVSVSCWIAVLCVKATRIVMWGFMCLGHAISGSMSRQMEFDADCHQTRLIGSETFASTFRRLGELSVAHQITFSDLQQFWDEGRLADDLPALVVANVSKITPEIRKEMRKQEEQGRTGLFDTHPADRDRMARAVAENTEGLIDIAAMPSEIPASALFGNFERLSKQVTLNFYREVLGPQIQPDVLHPVSHLLERQKVEIEAAKALRRYFQSQIPVMFPLPLGEGADQPPANPKETAATVRQCRQSMLDGLEEYIKVCERYERAEGELFNACRAMALLQAKLKIDYKSFNLSGASIEAATEKSRTVRKSLATLAQKQLPFETDAGERLSAALQLLFVPVKAELAEKRAALQQEMAVMIPEARFVSGLMSELRPFREVFSALLALCEQLEGNAENEQFRAAVLSKMQKVHDYLTRLRSSMGDHHYPFDHARAEMTLCEYALPEMPEPNDLRGILGATQHLFEQLITVQIRLFARLAVAAESVESALGLPILPDPKEAEKKTKAKRKTKVAAEE